MKNNNLMQATASAQTLLPRPDGRPRFSGWRTHRSSKPRTRRPRREVIMPSKKFVAVPPRIEDVEPQTLDLIQPLDPKVSEHRCGPRENCHLFSNLMAEMMIPAIILAVPPGVYCAREHVTPEDFNF